MSYFKLSYVFLTLICLSELVLAQEAGNINYMDAHRQRRRDFQVQLRSNSDLVISAKGICNIKADVFVAMFSLTQTGRTIDDVNNLIDERIQKVQSKLGTKAELYIDVISFVPVYEYDVTKKIFSKSYNEVPVGFEIKKNLHVKYTDRKLIHDILKICADAEIHDFVKVDHVSTKMQQHKSDLRTKVQAALVEKINYQSQLVGQDFSTLKKDIADGFDISYPAQMYKTYQSYSSSSLNVKSSKMVSRAKKVTTFYYQPVVDKNFDVVINNVIFEPVIQLLYEVKVLVHREEEQKKEVIKNQYMLVTPNGDVKNLPVGQ